MNIIKVNIADLNTAIAPDRIKTVGLGSCIGIIIFDQKNLVAGLAHIMLPTADISKEITNKAKYANTAVPLLLEEMSKLGALKQNMFAKIAGGAQMFKYTASNDILNIGPRNIEATKKILLEYKIPVIAEDVGGTIGRTIEFDLETGLLHIRTANQGDKKI
ncbi:MAG: chemotaxis protein CheD [Vulcanibacillus sp.]